MGFKVLFLLGFMLLVAIGLMVDLGLVGKSQKQLSFKQALWRTLFWIAAGLLFSLMIYGFHHQLHQLHSVADYQQFKTTYLSNFILFDNIDKCQSSFAKESVINYITGYFVEYSLSIDNLFVMMLIFKSFGVDTQDQKRILVWGVIGAVLMRFLFIFIGGMLVREFHWVMYLFGVFLLYTGIKILFSGGGEETVDTDNHPVVKSVSKIFKVSKNDSQGKFFVRENGKRMVSVLFVVLIMVEVTDVLFAVDSVPAIFGITRDPYIVFFSNIFAIMGLRSLFFLLGHSMKSLSTLQYGLSLILMFIGAKMIFQRQLNAVGFHEVHSLLVLGGILLLTYISSFLFPKKSLD